MKPLVLYGAGGHAREVQQSILDSNSERAQWDLLGFASANPAEQNSVIGGLPVKAWSEWVGHRVHVMIAIGSPAARRRVANQLRGDAVSFPTIVHPSVLRGARVHIGAGSFVAAGTIVTVDVALGDFVLVNRSVNISHDVTLADFVTIGPATALSGAVVVETGAELGTGVLAIPGVRIGKWCVVGAGSVVTRGIPDNVVAAGSPTRVLRTSIPGWQDKSNEMHV